MTVSSTQHYDTASSAATVRAPGWARTQRRILRRIQQRYARLPKRKQMAVDLTLHVVLPLVLGLAIYVPLAHYYPAVLNAWYGIVVMAMLLTALVISVECAHACRFPEPPLALDVADADLPTIGVVVAAYLVNEADDIMESLQHHLAVDYPRDKLIVVCAYNTPHRLPVEAELTQLANTDPRFVALCVDGSRSKAENLNAALDYLSGAVDIVGFFDADHHPHPTGLRRVARWLGDAAGEQRFDVVQGQCMIRNIHDSTVSEVVAVEFATIYSVSHPGRTALHGFGLFGGSNGFWRTEVINSIGMDAVMLTEDIDATSRALREGFRFATDPRIVSTELAPVTWSQLWRQRLRWAQGWWEVTLRHAVPLLKSPHMNTTQKRGVLLLYVWRVIHPWVGIQMVPLIAAIMIAGHSKPGSWAVPLFALTSLMTLGVPFLQALVAMRLAPPGLREKRWLFLKFGLLSLVFYSEFKAIVNRAAVVRDVLGVHQWTVTPRQRGLKAATQVPVQVPVQVPA